MITSTRARVHVGEDATALLAHHAATIDARAGVFCRTAAWLERIVRTLGREPVLVTVSDDQDRLIGLLALERRRRWGLTRVATLGADLNDYAPAFAADAAVAEAMAAALSAWLRTEQRWSLTLAQLDDAALAEALTHATRARVSTGPPMPAITDVTAFVPSKGARKANAKTANRLRADGRNWAFERHGATAPDGIVDELIALRRERDHAHGRRSHLDAPEQREFYRATVAHLLEHEGGAVHALRVDGRLAGYVVVAHDAGTHRTWDGRVAVGFERYRAGAACTWRAREEAAADPRVERFDWLRGITQEKLHDHVVELPTLEADSHRWITTLRAGGARARAAARALVPTALRRRMWSRD